MHAPSVKYTYLGQQKLSFCSIIQATTKAVLKGLQDLLKYLLQFVEEELQKDSEASIFSVFLILRLAFSIHLPPPPKQKTGSGLSFFSVLFGTDEALERAKPQQKERVEMESVVGTNVEECDGESKKESLEMEENGDLEQDPAELHRRAQVEEKSPSRNDSHDVGSSEGVEDKDKPSPSQDMDENSVSGENGERLSLQDVSKQNFEFQDPLSNMTHSSLDGSPVRTIGSASSAFTCTTAAESTGGLSRLTRAQPIATPPLSEQQHHRYQTLTNGHLPDPSHERVRRASLNPSEQGSPLRKGRAVSPSHQLLLELLASPRVHRPNETEHQLAGCVFLYKELMKSLGNVRSFLLEKKFWDILFMAVISTDRNQLGWNEKTTELYTR